MFMLVCNKNKTRKKSANKKQNEVQHNQHDHQSYLVVNYTSPGASRLPCEVALGASHLVQ